MHRHVSPGTAGCGEHHVAASALEHPRVVMRGQVSVEAATAKDRVCIMTSFTFVNVKLLVVGQSMLTNYTTGVDR